MISKKERSEALQYKRRPSRMFGLFIVPEVPGSQVGMLRVLERIFQLNRWDLIILEFLEYDEDNYIYSKNSCVQSRFFWQTYEFLMFLIGPHVTHYSESQLMVGHPTIYLLQATPLRCASLKLVQGTGDHWRFHKFC